MHQDKKPIKFIILGALMVAVIIGFIIFFAIRAQASPPFLPIDVFETPGGISVWLAKDNTLPIIALHFWFQDSGTAHDQPTQQGLVRLLSNTLDEGAGELDATAFQGALQNQSISLFFEATRDGFGGELKTLTHTKEQAFDLLALALSSPRFDDEPIKRMVDANISRIKEGMSDPQWISARIMNDRLFNGHPYSQNSGGTIKTLPMLEAKHLKAFKEAALTKDRLMVVVSGNITKDAASTAIDKIFAALPAQGMLPPLPSLKVQNLSKTFVYDKDIPQSVIQIALPAFGRDDPDFYALQVLNYILGGAGFGSRLIDEAREKRGLTYGIYSSVDDYRKGSILSVSTSTKNESVGEMINVIHDTMKALQNTPVSDKELADAKSYLTGSMPLMLSSTDAIASLLLSLRVESLPETYLDHYAKNINAVTSADIQRVAKRILSPDKTITVIVGRPQNIKDSIVVRDIPNV